MDTYTGTRWYTKVLVGLIILLLISALLFVAYYFVIKPNLMSTQADVSQGESLSETRPVSPAQAQRELLDRLLPEDLVDTPEEIRQREQELDALMRGSLEEEEIDIQEQREELEALLRDEDLLEESFAEESQTQ